MQWINFLHLYQPPTQTSDVLELISRESYVRIVELLETYQHLHLTLNISGSLLELLDKNGHAPLISRYRKLIESGRIELVGSAMYHPILPLLPEHEIRRHIQLNQDCLKKYFGENITVSGFYFPEMAYSPRLNRIIEDFGYTWIILDDVGHFPYSQKAPSSEHTRYIIKDSGLSVIFRNRLFSKTFPPEFILEQFEHIKNSTLITAHDGELYGHLHKDDRRFYTQIFSHPHITTRTVSEYLKGLIKTEVIQPREGSWEDSFLLWNDPKNKIHTKLWKFATLTRSIVEKHTTDPNYSFARSCIDKGYASCSWWWASNKKLGVFSPLTWNPTEIEKGLTTLLVGVRSLQGAQEKEYISVEKKAHTLRELIWKKHWQLYTKVYENRSSSIS